MLEPIRDTGSPFGNSLEYLQLAGNGEFLELSFNQSGIFESDAALGELADRKIALCRIAVPRRIRVSK